MQLPLRRRAMDRQATHDELARVRADFRRLVA